MVSADRNVVLEDLESKVPGAGRSDMNVPIMGFIEKEQKLRRAKTGRMKWLIEARFMLHIFIHKGLTGVWNSVQWRMKGLKKDERAVRTHLTKEELERREKIDAMWRSMGL